MAMPDYCPHILAGIWRLICLCNSNGQVRIGEAADFGTLMTAPVASKDTVFAITPDTMLTALDIADGSIRWSLLLEDRMDTTQP
jgi:glucose dehydrogenase